MYVDAPLIAISARKHGVRDHDMIHAFNHPILVDDLEVGIIDSSDGRSSFTLCPPDRST